jgi:spermidine/putrescine transport system ATP-binding protein
MQIDLSVQNITKTFKEFVAVDKVSFEVPDGQFFSILGPSGCGKTTLLRMIAGLTEPTDGNIEIRGQSMLGIAPNKRPVNLIFQHLALFPMMNVKQNIAFGLNRRGESKAVIEKRWGLSWKELSWQDLMRKKSTSCPGGRNRGWRLPAVLCSNPPYCCWMNPWAPWI